jgi:Transglycosylase-like domain
VSITHKGRHRRPTRTVKVLSATAGAGAIASVISASPAMAMTTITGPGTDPFPVLPPVTPKVATTTAFTEVTVERGNTLSGIAGRFCHNPADWTGWYNRNKRTIGGDPDVIEVGQHLIPDCRDEKVWLPQAPVFRAVSYSTPQYSNSPSQGSGYGSYGNVNPGGYGGIESCIISRESGGNSQVMNSSGHYGLFQFDYGTWASGGGNPGDFGHASVQEQQRVFQNVYAARGAEPWAPSDGC